MNLSLDNRDMYIIQLTGLYYIYMFALVNACASIQGCLFMCYIQKKDLYTVVR